MSAAVRIHKDGEYLFGGKLLDCVDTDITMNKRAKEVASRLAKPRRDVVFRSSASIHLFFLRGQGHPFVPTVEDSAAPHAAEEGPMVGVPPSGSLPPFRVVYDYSGDLWVSDFSPVGGSRIPFYPKVTSVHFRSIFSFRNQKRFSNISSEQFYWGLSENLCDLVGSKGDPLYSRRDTGSDFKKRDRSNKRISEFVFVPVLCDPLKIGVFACHPESQ